MANKLEKFFVSFLGLKLVLRLGLFSLIAIAVFFSGEESFAQVSDETNGWGSVSVSTNSVPQGSSPITLVGSFVTPIHTPNCVSALEPSPFGVYLRSTSGITFAIYRASDDVKVSPDYPFSSGVDYYYVNNQPDNHCGSGFSNISPLPSYANSYQLTSNTQVPVAGLPPDNYYVAFEGDYDSNADCSDGEVDMNDCNNTFFLNFRAFYGYPGLSTGFTVTPPALPTNIEVNTNLDTSGFLDGPGGNDYSGSWLVAGNPTVYSNVVTGDYTITPDPLACYGFSVAPSLTQTVNSGGTITFNVTYFNDGSCPPTTPPDVEIYFNSSSNPAPINSGASGILDWTVSGSASNLVCNASVDWSGSKNVSGGSEAVGPLVNPPASRTYTITCNNDFGSDVDSVTVNINPPVGNPPIVAMTIDWSGGPLNVMGGHVGQIRWTVSGGTATSCAASNNGGDTNWDFDENPSVLGGGPVNTSPMLSSRTYTIDCSGPGGSDSSSVDVNVTNSLSPSVVIEVPASGAVVSGIVNMEGWAMDNTTQSETTIRFVETYFYPVAGPPWQNPALASYGLLAKPAICAAYPPPRPGCDNIGWQRNWDSTTVPNGVYTAMAVVWDSDSQQSGGVEIWPGTGVYGRQGFTFHNFTVNNPIPTASNVSVAQPNYCLAGPSNVTVSWTYSDTGGNPQSAYQVQIDNNSNFSSPEVDSGQVFSAGTSYAPAGGLSFANTYYARVRVWSSLSIVSAWSSSFSWATPPHAYPAVNFTYSPPNPARNVSVAFTDATIFSTGIGNSWAWNFNAPPVNPNPPVPATSTSQNPTVVFADASQYYITLTATDGDGHSCSSPPALLSVQKPVPVWIEVLPR